MRMVAIKCQAQPGNNRDIFNTKLLRVCDLYDKQTISFHVRHCKKRRASLKSYMVWQTLVSITREYTNNISDNNMNNVGDTALQILIA